MTVVPGADAPSRPSTASRPALAPRVARTFAALLGVCCLAVTAAAAGPVPGLEAPLAPADVFALGDAGLGTLDTSTGRAEGTDVAAAPDAAGSASGPDGGRALSSSGGASDDGTDVGDAGEAVIPLLGAESLAAVVPSGLGLDQVPDVSRRAYLAAAEVMRTETPACGIDWALLAAIGRVESNHGRFGGATVTADGVSLPRILGPRLDGSLAGTMVIRDSDGGTLDGDSAFDRAAGPMQFLPGTWQRWGSDGDRDGRRDPQDIDDAALAAARYLCSAGVPLDGDPAVAAVAIRRYNNSSEYVQLVLGTAATYRSGAPVLIGPAPGSPAAPFFPAAAPAPGWTLPPGVTPGSPPAAGPGAQGPGGQGPGGQGSSRPSTSPRPDTGPSGNATSRPGDNPTTPDRPSPAPSNGPTSAPTTGPSTGPTTPTTAPTSPPPSSDPTTTPPSDPPSSGTPSVTPPSEPSPPTCTPTDLPSADPSASVEPTPGPSADLPQCPPPCGPDVTPSAAPSADPAPTPTCVPVSPEPSTSATSPSP